VGRAGQVSAPGRSRPGGGGRCGLWGRLAYVVAVKGTTSAYAQGAVPVMMACSGRGRPPVPRYRSTPANLRQLAIAHVSQARPVTWRQVTKAIRGHPPPP